jgi:hypothetical protein
MKDGEDWSFLGRWCCRRVCRSIPKYPYHFLVCEYDHLFLSSLHVGFNLAILFNPFHLLGTSNSLPRNPSSRMQYNVKDSHAIHALKCHLLAKQRIRLTIPPGHKLPIGDMKKIKVEVTTQIHSRYRRLHYAPIDTSIHEVLVELLVSGVEGCLSTP